MQVARAGESASPPLPSPPTLRRFLRFARLPAPALDVARRAVDDDAEFRARVAESVTEVEVGEAGWLWLARPVGWEARLQEIHRAEQDREHAEREERADRDAHRRLAHAEDRARRAEAVVAELQHELAVGRAELAEARAVRNALEADADAVVARARELAEERQAAVRRLKEVEAELSQRNAELRQARAEGRERDEELDSLRSQLARSALDLPLAAPARPAAGPAPVTEAGSRRDAALSAAIGRAASAAEQLSAALAQASGILVPDPPAGAGHAAPPRTVGAARHLARRAAPKLPPGVLDDGPEAADHLLRLPKSVLVVDGYNVSMAAWGTQPIAVQRARLVDALAELHARTGTEVEVVFDGAEPTGPVVPAAARAGVRVRFSPPDVEADDVVLDRLDSLPAERAVVVASSDARVREGARRRGANVLTAGQLITAMKR